MTMYARLECLVLSFVLIGSWDPTVILRNLAYILHIASISDPLNNVSPVVHAYPAFIVHIYSCISPVIESYLEVKGI